MSDSGEKRPYTKRNTPPSTMQKNAFDSVTNRGKNVTTAMREAGYAEATVNNPKDLTESDGWQKLMDEHFPEEKLARVHSEGLDAERAVVVSMGAKNGSMIEMVEDHAVRHKYLETGYKLRGKLNDKKEGLGLIGIFSLADLAKKRDDMIQGEIIQPPQIPEQIPENDQVEPYIEAQNEPVSDVIQEEV